MKNTDKITMTIGQLKRLIKESRKKLMEAKLDFGYVYLSELFYKQPANVPQRMLRKIFKKYEEVEPDLNEEVQDWLDEMIILPKNEWITPKEKDDFVEVVWDQDGGGRGYGSAPALKFSNYEAAEKCAYLLSSYGEKDVGWGITRSWIGRTYP